LVSSLAPPMFGVGRPGDVPTGEVGQVVDDSGEVAHLA
jgi:hypothetical protein